MKRILPWLPHRPVRAILGLICAVAAITTPSLLYGWVAVMLLVVSYMDRGDY